MKPINTLCKYVFLAIMLPVGLTNPLNIFGLMSGGTLEEGRFVGFLVWVFMVVFLHPDWWLRRKDIF